MVSSVCVLGKSWFSFGQRVFESISFLLVKFCLWSFGVLASQVFWLLPKSKLRVKSSQVGGGILLSQRVLRSVRLPNKACSRLVGFVPTYEHFSGFGFFLLPSRIPARPPAANANRWHAPCKIWSLL